jgi:O-acetylserine/cysteine efflux transporter
VTVTAQPTLESPSWSDVGPLLVMAGINVIWGCAFPLTRPALQDVPPFTFALLRFTLTLAVLLPLSWRSIAPLLRGGDRGLVVAAGVFGFTLAQLGQVVGLRWAPSSHGAIITTLTPVVVALLARIWLGERLSLRVATGLLLAVVGLVLVVWPAGGPMPGSEGGHLFGDLAFVVSTTCWGAYNVVGRGLMMRHKPLPITTTTCFVGTLGIVPFAAWEWTLGRAPVLSPIAIAAVAYTGLLVTVLGFLCLFWALGRVSAVRVAALMYIQPLAGVLLAWAWLGEAITPRFLGGGVLVLMGVSFITLTSGWKQDRGLPAR